MKISNLHIPLILSLLACGVSTSLGARNVFKVSWHGKAYTTSPDGRVISRTYSQQEILSRYAEAASVDPKTLSVAYIRDNEEPAEALEIVNAVDGSSVANIFNFLAVWR